MADIDFETILCDSSRSLADYVTSVVGADPQLFDQVLDLALELKPRISMRAARVADLDCLKHPELIRPRLAEIAGLLPDITDHSVRRILLHILIRHPWVEDEDAMGRLVETLLTWLQDERQDLAARSYSINMMEKICEVEPMLGRELALVLQESLPGWNSVTLRKQGQKVLTRLMKEHEF